MTLPEPLAALVRLGGVALLLAPGLGLAELLPALRRLALAHRLGFAYLLGVAWTAGGLYVLSHTFAVPLGRPAVLGLAALPAAAGLAAWRLRLARRPAAAPPAEAAPPTGAPPKPRLRRSRAALTAIGVGAVVSLAVWAEAVTNPVRDWDGRMTWVTQARYVRAERTVDATALRGEAWYVTHPQYPLLLPLAQVAVEEATGAPDDSQAFRALYAAFFPAYLLVLHAGASRWAGRRAAALAVLAAALVPFLPFYDAGGAGGTYSDLPLACFFGAGLLLLLDRARAPGPRASWIAFSAGLAAGLLLAGATLAKNEGALLALWALALGLLTGLLAWRRRRRRSAGRGLPPGLLPLAVAAVPVVLALLLLVSWRAGIPNRFDERYDEITSICTLLPEAIRRVPVLLPVVLKTMLSGQHWGLLWWLLPVFLGVGRRGLRRRLALPLALAALAPPAIAWGAYAVFPNPGFLAAVTWNRFLVQASLPGFWLLALALRELLEGPLPAWMAALLAAAGLASGRVGKARQRSLASAGSSEDGAQVSEREARV